MLDKILGCRESLVTCTALIGAFLLYVSFNTSSHVVLLTSLPACVMKPLQMIQHAAAHLVFNQLKRAHVTRLLIELHWLPVGARIKFKSLMLAYRVIDCSAPTYLNVRVRANVTPRMPRSPHECHLALPSVQLRQSRLFSFVIPRW